MIPTLLIVIVVLVLALWISTMALWRQHEAGIAAKSISKRDVVKALQKAERLARRTAYSSLRYSKSSGGME